MKIINAVWEQRNLGVDAAEIQFEMNDRIEDIADSFENVAAAYLVAKIPGGRGDLCEFVQDHEYRYIEDLIQVEHDLHEPVRTPLHQRLYNATSYRKMTEEDIDILQREVMAGMFDSDRISQDYVFGKDVAAKRYCNWIHDLIEQGATPYVILYKEESTGFVILKTADGVYYESVLGGGYRRYRNTGLGLIQKEQEIVRRAGGKRVTTHVSSNNPAQLRALMINGYVPMGIDHIFVKHQEEYR